MDAVTDQLGQMHIAAPPPDLALAAAIESMHDLQMSTGMPDEVAKKFKFLHLTKKTATRIYASPDPHRNGIAEPAVWTQLCQVEQPCCPSFGQCKIPLRWGHLQRVAGEWCLWHADETAGAAPGHVFHKFVLAPASADYAARGWRIIFRGKPSLDDKSPPQATIFPKLVQAAFTAAPDVPGRITHRHVGVLVDFFDETPTPVRSGLTGLSESSLTAHNAALQQIERCQFHCPTHGIFWKKCEARKRVARCMSCQVQGALSGAMSWSELNEGDGGEASGVAPRLKAVPLEEERGRGRFTCESCGNQWTSNRACRALGQYCQAEGCDAESRAELTFPQEIRQPKLFTARGGGGYARAAARNGAPPVQQVREDEVEVEDAERPGFGAEHTPYSFEHAPYSFGRDCAASLPEVAANGGEEARPEPRPSSGPLLRSATSASARKHWCSGCAEGLCRKPPPQSEYHDSSGSTVTLAARTWTTNASDAWSDGSID